MAFHVTPITRDMSTSWRRPLNVAVAVAIAVALPGLRVSNFEALKEPESRFRLNVGPNDALTGCRYGSVYNTRRKSPRLARLVVFDRICSPPQRWWSRHDSKLLDLLYQHLPDA